MALMVTFPFTSHALKVEQPLGTFFVALLPAELLLQVAASDVMTATLDAGGAGYALSGTQRLIKDTRLKQIADYIDRIDSVFPNAIILAANYNRQIGMDEDEYQEIHREELGQESASAFDRQDKAADAAWTVTPQEGDRWLLTIPTSKQLAAIIDGQHRIFAFAYSDKRRLNMMLLCSIFLDLPKPYQAQIFATINSTQKPVDRSLTYELFGYNVSEEKEKFWTPDKLAVFLARKLATEEESPLRGRVVVAPKHDEQLETSGDWRVSTAVVVDGILRLFSSNPRRDSNTMHTSYAQPRSVLMSVAKDRSPLREVFISENDAVIYAMVYNYLRACDEVFWKAAVPGSFIVKAVGIQALFDVLRKIARSVLDHKDLRVEMFQARLANAGNIDFSAEVFRNASGSGRSSIRRAIESALNL